jgi:hypothetical protein
MFPVFFQQPQSLEPATDLVGEKTGRRSQDIGKENYSHALGDLGQVNPNKRQRLFDEAMACATIHLTAETSTSSVVFSQLFPTGSLQPQSCIQRALPPRFFDHISPKQAFSPLPEQLDEVLSDLSDNEGGDAMDGAACRTFNPQNPGTPREQEARAQDGFVTPIGCDDELQGLLGQTSPQDNLQRSPSGLAKILEARLARINLGPEGE